ncbi:MAG: hypothetical protein H0W50_01340 [Parachlamydiaceae bacterium]|nr:hypothetical protein [Parachlamydiaceae bacterium]
MNINSKPLFLYQTNSVEFKYFQDYMISQIPVDIILSIKEYYIALAPIPKYDECKTKINNDLFPTQVYRQLKLMKDSSLGDYKVGGSAALKLASADMTWENDDIDIMVYTEMDTYEYASQLGLTTLTKSWTKGLDQENTEREERFHKNIYQVLTFQHNDLTKKSNWFFLKNLTILHLQIF